MLLKFASASTQLSNDPLPCYCTTLLLRPFHRTVLMVTSVSTATAWHLFSDVNQTYAHSLRQISRHTAKTASYQHDAAIQLQHNSHPSHNLPNTPPFNSATCPGVCTFLGSVAVQSNIGSSHDKTQRVLLPPSWYVYVKTAITAKPAAQNGSSLWFGPPKSAANNAGFRVLHPHGQPQ